MRKNFTSIIFPVIFCILASPAMAQTKQPELSPPAQDQIAKITMDMSVLPPDFIGHDIRILYNNLAALGNNVKGKVVYGVGGGAESSVASRDELVSPLAQASNTTA